MPAETLIVPETQNSFVRKPEGEEKGFLIDDPIFSSIIV